MRLQRPTSPTTGHSGTSPRKRHPAVLMSLALLALTLHALLLPHYLALGHSVVALPQSSDFYKFYLSGQRPLAGFSPYWQVPPREAPGDFCHPDTPRVPADLGHPPGRMSVGGAFPCLSPNLNPPAFVALVRPLTLLPYQQAWWTWTGLSTACGALAIALLVTACMRPWPARLAWWVAGCAAMVTTFPTLANFMLGQLGMVLLLALTLVWRLGRAGHDGWAGVGLGLAVGLKPFLLPLLWPYAAAGRWRLLSATAATVLATLALGAVVFGADVYRDYAQIARSVQWMGSNWNASWMGLFDRAFISVPQSTWPATKPLSHALAGGFALMTLAVFARFCRQRLRAGATADDCMAALGPATALLVSPLGWVYYFPMLWLSAAVIWQRRSNGDWTAFEKLAATALGLAMCVPVALKQGPSPLMPAQWWGMGAWFNGVLVGWFVCLTFSAFRTETDSHWDCPVATTRCR